MDTATQTLVIIVSAVLTIFLVAFIVAIVHIVKLVKQIRYLAARAESVADSVESAANVFEKSASPFMIIKTIGNIIEQASKVKRRKG